MIIFLPKTLLKHLKSLKPAIPVHNLKLIEIFMGRPPVAYSDWAQEYAAGTLLVPLSARDYVPLAASTPSGGRCPPKRVALGSPL